jgi:outer membrane protein assembly factor BamB
MKLVWAALALVVSPLDAADWPMLMYNLEHHSFNKLETTLNSSNVGRLLPAWTAELPDKFASAPVIESGVLYVGGWSGDFYALNANTGELLWKSNVGLSPPPEDPACGMALGVTASPVIKGDTVYVGGGDSRVYALNKADGSVLWSVGIGDPANGAYIWSSLMLEGNKIHVGIASLGDCPLVPGALITIDLNHPRNPTFTYLTPDDIVGAGIWSTPAIDTKTKKIFVTTGTGEQDADIGLWGGTLLRLHAETLKIEAYYFLPTNNSETDIEWGSSPVAFKNADGVPMVAASGKDGILYALKQEDLSVEWTRQVALGCICPECGCGSLSTPAFDGATLYTGAGASEDADTEAGTVYALDPSSGNVIWRQLLEGTVIAPVTVANGLVFASTMRGVEIFDAVSGERLWRSNKNGVVYSQPVVCNGTLYTTYLDGSIIAYRPDI